VNEAARAAYQKALLRTLPRWQTLAVLLTGLLLSFFIPVMALCGTLPQAGLVWAIAGTTVTTGLGSCGAAWLLERKSRDSRIVDDLLFSGVLMIAAGLLWSEFAVQSGPVRGRTLEFWSSLAIIVMAAVAGAVLMHRRAARLASLSAPTLRADGV
jgi:hypothetical protein